MSVLRSILVISTMAQLAWTQPYHPDPARVDCADGYCLVLYRGKTARHWGWASSDCIEAGNSFLVPILTSDVQGRVERLLQAERDSGTSDIQEVWTAGRRSGDRAWTLLDGTNLDSGATVAPGEGHCLYSVCDMNEFTPDNCADENVHLRTVCQKPAGAYSAAGPYNILSGGYSYRVVDETDWFSARTLCVQDGGDLIHSNIGLPDSTICDKLGEANRQFWIGVTKYPWQWRLSDQDKQDIKYYNWESETDRPDEIDQCLAVDTRLGYRWKPKSCSQGSTTHYFICANGSLLGSPTTSTTTTRPTTTTTITTTESPTTMTSVTTTTTSTTTPAPTDPTTPTPPTPTDPTTPTPTDPTTPTPTNPTTPTPTDPTTSTPTDPTTPNLKTESGSTPDSDKKVDGGSSAFKWYYIVAIGAGVVLIVVIAFVIAIRRSGRNGGKKSGSSEKLERGSDPSAADVTDPGYASANTSDGVIPSYSYGEYPSETPEGSNQQRKPPISSKKPKLTGAGVPHVMTTEGDMYAVSLNDKRLLEESRQSPVDHITTDTGDVYALPMKSAE